MRTLTSLSKNPQTGRSTYLESFYTGEYTIELWYGFCNICKEDRDAVFHCTRNGMVNWLWDTYDTHCVDHCLGLACFDMEVYS